MSRALVVLASIALLSGTPVVDSSQARDTASQAGSAAIVGTVVERENARTPLRRVVVTVAGNELALSRSAITDDEGRFAIRGLPPGTFSVTASKGAYVTGAYGALRPGRPGTPLVLAAGQKQAVTIELSRAAALTGIVRDEKGSPVSGVRVMAINPTNVGEALTRNVPGWSSITDDRGVYRLHSLQPRIYVIAAAPIEIVAADITRRSVQDMDAALARLQRPPSAAVSNPSASSSTVSTAPVYFPGTSLLSSATRVKVGVGETRDGLDFVLTPVPVTTIEGQVVADVGLPAGVQLSIRSADAPRLPSGGGIPQLVQPVGPDGRFRYSTIVPGRYTLMARGTGTAPPRGRGGAPAPVGPVTNSTEVLYAVEQFDVRGAPVTGLVLRMQPGPVFAGRVIVDPEAGAPPDLTKIRVSVRSTDGTVFDAGRQTVGSLGTIPPVFLAADGTFQITGLPPADYMLQLDILPASSPWWLRSAMVDGRDVLDTALSLPLGRNVTDAILTMSNRRSSLAGAITTADSRPAPSHFVVVMPVNPEWRRKDSRRLRFVRPDTDGRFAFDTLPAGDYLLMALSDLDPDEWHTTEFLGSIAAAGIRVTLADGEAKTQNLQIR